MLFFDLFFYIISTFLIISSLLVIFSKNKIYSAISLIVALIQLAFIAILFNAEFLGFIIIIIYVGAVVILFLFIIMMCDNDNDLAHFKFNKKLFFIAFILFSTLLIEIISIINISDFEINKKINNNISLFTENNSNIEAIGNILYTDFIVEFQSTAILLLVAMISAIILTENYRKKRFVRHQSIYEQVTRNKKESLEMVKIKSKDNINLEDAKKKFKNKNI